MLATDLDIQLFTPEDEILCLELFRSNVPLYFKTHEEPGLLEWLYMPGRAPYYVVSYQSNVVGCGGLYADEKEKCCGLAWGMIHQDEHKKGFGKAFSLYRLEQLSQLFPGYKQKLVTSHLTEGFYQKLGFQTTSHKKDGIAPGLDECWMERN